MIKNKIMAACLFSSLINHTYAAKISVDILEEYVFDSTKMTSKKLTVDFCPEDNSHKDVDNKNITAKVKKILVEECGHVVWNIQFKNIFDNKDYEYAGFCIGELFHGNYINKSTDISCLAHKDAEIGIKDNIDLLLLPAIRHDFSEVQFSRVKKRKLHENKD